MAEAVHPAVWVTTVIWAAPDRGMGVMVRRETAAFLEMAVAFLEGKMQVVRLIWIGQKVFPGRMVELQEHLKTWPERPG